MQNRCTPQPTYCIRLALNTLSFAQNKDDYDTPKKKKNTTTLKHGLKKQKVTDKRLVSHTN